MVIQVPPSSRGKFGEDSPHLLGNIEKGKSEEKSLATEARWIVSSGMSYTLRLRVRETLSGLEAGWPAGVVEHSVLAICGVRASGRIGGPWRDRGPLRP